MKFTTPKSEPKTKVEEPTIEVEVKARTISTLQMRTSAGLLVEDLMALLAHGSKFAEHCSLIHGIGGLEGILILKSILTDAELDPDTSLLDRMLQEMKDSEADELMILMVDYDDAVRQSVDSTIKHYFTCADNDFKPSAETLEKVLKSSLKVGSIEDLISALEAKLFKGKK